MVLKKKTKKVEEETVAVENQEIKEDGQKEEGQGLLVKVFVKSQGYDTIQKKEADGTLKKYMRASLNGVSFEIPCDVVVELPPEKAACFEGIMSQQAGK